MKVGKLVILSSTTAFTLQMQITCFMHDHTMNVLNSLDVECVDLKLVQAPNPLAKRTHKKKKQLVYSGGSVRRSVLAGSRRPTQLLSWKDACTVAGTVTCTSLCSRVCSITIYCNNIHITRDSFAAGLIILGPCIERSCCSPLSQ